MTNVKVILAGLEAYGVMWAGIDVMAGECIIFCLRDLQNHTGRKLTVTGEVRAALEAASRLPAEIRAQIESASASPSTNPDGNQ